MRARGSVRRFPRLSRGYLLASSLGIALLSLGEALAIDSIAVGEHVAPFTLTDQHDVSHTIDEHVRVILFSRDMDGGDLLKQALADVPEGWLDERGIAYVSDISGMPKLVARLFALPSMRRRPYAMWLDRDGSATALLPDAAGRATLIHLEARRVTRIEHLDDVEAIAAALALPASD